MSHIHCKRINPHANGWKCIYGQCCLPISLNKKYEKYAWNFRFVEFFDSRIHRMLQRNFLARRKLSSFRGTSRDFFRFRITISVLKKISQFQGSFERVLLDLLESMCFIQNNAAAYRAQHTSQNNTQTNTSSVHFMARIVKQDNLWRWCKKIHQGVRENA